jgi:uncharacterized RmlC-like cupin family protein
MSEARPLVVRLNDATAGPATPGMERRQLLQAGDRWVGWVRTEPGVSSAWHHHAGNDSYIFVTKGSLTIDFGPGGRERAVAGPGDFIFNPAFVVHRETTAPEGEVEAWVVRVGDETQVENVDGPDPD